MSKPYNKDLIPRARELRRNMTPTERKLWYQFLSKHPAKIQRQKTINSYIVDFYCHSKGIAIEIDGSQHFEEGAIQYDQERTKILENYGVKVVRFTNNDNYP